MRATYISALSLVLSGCAVTTSGTDEAVLFSDKDASADQVQTVLKPHHDLPLALEFSCPAKLATLMTSAVIPLPPVLPVGFVNEHVSYLRVQMPEGTDDAMAQTRIITPQGTTLSLSDARQLKRTVNHDGLVEVTYSLNEDCEALNGGMLELAGVSYKNTSYPASQARLQFDSRIKAGVSWWPPLLFNGGRPVGGGTQ